MQSATAMSRVDECVQTNMSDAAGTSGSDIPQQLADDSLRKNRSFQVTGDRHLSKFRSKAPVAPDDPPDQTAMSQVVEPSCGAVSLAGGIK